MRIKCEQQIEIFRCGNLPCDTIIYVICTRSPICR
jgi:hypothetical protein